MRVWSFILIVAMAGCASDPPTADDSNDGGGDLAGSEAMPGPPGDTNGTDEYAIPEAVHATGVLPLGSEWECFVEACPSYPFELFGPTEVDLRLSWNILANDIDVFVYDEKGTAVMEGTDGAPQTEEHETARLPAGKYRVSIEPYETVTDEYTLAVTFERPKA